MGKTARYRCAFHEFAGRSAVPGRTGGFPRKKAGRPHLTRAVSNGKLRPVQRLATTNFVRGEAKK